MKLINLTKNTVLAETVEVADTPAKRMVGLIGRKYLASKSALQISRCNSIHTFFMQFAIDVLFVSRDLKVCSIKESIPPWRMTMPVLKAHSVFEFSANTLNSSLVEIGDQLHVGN